MTVAQVKLHNGTPSIVINGKAYPPMMAAIRPNKERLLDTEYYEGLTKGGIEIFYLLCDTEWAVPGSVAKLQGEIEALLKINPNAYIMLRIGLHPSDEWIEENPDECLTYNDGSKPDAYLYYDIQNRQLKNVYSLASEKWRNRATEALNETCDVIDKMPYADRIVGYFFAAGGTSEWYYPAPLEKAPLYGDFSQAFKREFSKLLKEKYKTIKNLRAHWKDDEVTFDNPKIYDLAARYFAKQYDKSYWFDDEYPATYGNEMHTNGSNIGSFLDVDKFLGVYDFYRSWHLAVADSQIHFAKFIKEKYNNTKITGSFYGSFGATDFFSCTAGGVLRILDSGYMDSLAAPGVYFNRQLGGFTGQRQAHDSYRLRNKIYIIEEDTRTHMEMNHFKNLFDYYELSDSEKVLKRDFGRNICEDTQAWWYDNDRELKRYKDEGIYQLFKQQQAIAKEAYKKDRTKKNEIALIFDEESISLVSNRTTIEVVELFRNYEIARIGTGVDQYYHNDLSHPNMPDYKLYVFFNTFTISDKEREVIHKKLKKNNATALWIYAPGIINFDGKQKFDVDHMSKLTGIKMKELREKWPTKFRINKDSTLFKSLDKMHIFGVNDRPMHSNILINFPRVETFASPVFYADDKDAKHEAYYLLNKLPAVSVKETNGFRSVYHGSKVLRAGFVRELAKSCGIHIYSDSEDVVYVNESYITIHASTTGKKTINFKKESKLIEVYTHEIIQTIHKQATFDMTKGDTLMFEIIPNQ